MTVNQFLDTYIHSGVITDSMVVTLQESEALRQGLVHYFRIHKNRKFTLALLDKLTSLRNMIWEGALPVSGDEIMLAGYIVGLHGKVEDSLKIWNAKSIDFDAFCYIDIQLVVFTGVQSTLEYLKNQPSDEARAAFEYITDCEQAGDFNTLGTYYSPEEMPWFV